ncbi:MAG: phosphatidate cytidylyltransferase [Legionellales bacterium]|nr:phosphatidate cytidylyltransferase [Legionellales bacterium]|tara:strand:+ start:1312 stop:2133 length:822 start_codon:yes stop_codon:yes gene_type:complete
MLKQRIITAAMMIPIVIAIIFLLDTVWFSIFIAILVSIGAWEWAGLCRLSKKYQYVYSSLFLLILACLYSNSDMNVYYEVLIGGVFYWFVAIFLIFSYQSKYKLLPKSSSILLVMGLFLLIPMWVSLNVLKSFPENGASLIMFLMLLIWGADTAAYFVGKKWGKRQLASQVSPRKTWEGSLGGIIAGIGIALAFVIVSDQTLTRGVVLIGLSILTVSISIIGDLTESMVKREANIKDSGFILPGHGGVMDRIDSLTAAAPVFAFGIVNLGIGI